MKGYVLLSIVSVFVLLCAPLSALPRAAKPSVSVTPSADIAEDTACFRVKNTATGDILTMEEDAFVIAVVSCEMGAASPTEALKAQAVATYTYFCKQRAAAVDGVFSNVPESFFKNSTEEGMRSRWGDQYDRWYTALADAQKAVKGKRILYNGEPITACYHAISAGMTDSAADVWGGNYPYLQPVDSPGDLSVDGYETVVTLTTAQVTDALKTLDANFATDEAPEQWFHDTVTTASGLVKSTVVGTHTFVGGKLRAALGLRSACFTVSYADGRFTFTVHGYGHNVGMSQMGAKYMANQGADYVEILTHYYPGTTVA